ncbi:MAG TPA: glycerol-3-phosphate acyltransferase, partial [Dehalococcoidia bacterium]|nr:glycerol-3-phosphate acyltransferase [Dehalococcoidia bacterium]
MNIDPVFQWILAILVSYLLGSIPSAYLAGKFGKKVDIRDIGSRNMGAMNTFYSVGIAAGLLVLLVDICKGTVAVYFTELIFGIENQPVTLMQYVSGIAVVLGHAFPVWLKFRGGKGGATCIGALARMIPWGCPYYLGLFLLLTAITKFPTFSYAIAFITFPIISVFYYPESQPWLAIYSVAILLIPGALYIPRLKEMRQKGGGGWKRVFKR